jgi:hypothetical protein
MPPISAAVTKPFCPAVMFHSTPGKAQAITTAKRSPTMARTVAR